ncbi:MAG TPA: competence/damage-inducible protein A [Frankiaceae bacterium]|nr:competence/damage-inducible protein A [Frankiaceae bacterium]
MRVELLAVGTELLFGDIVNTNAAWLGRRLAEVGMDVTTSVVVGDNVARIADALTVALGRADAVVVTGGIGPTQDDLTREAFAAAAGVSLERDPALEQALRDRFTALRRDVPEMNYRQADLPAGATSIPNPKGSAPGVRAEIGGGVAYALPGVPHEMKQMFTDTVLPDLLRIGGQPACIVHRVLRTAGMWESAVAAALADQVERLEREGGVTVAFLASGGQTRVRLTAKAATEDEARALIAPEEAAARQALGTAVYGADDDTLAKAVSDLLKERGATVAVAESLTGGLLGADLSNAPGSSDTFLGGVVSYATEVKHAVLGVPEGIPVISDECAAAMARGVRELMGSTYALSLTGVAGPAEQEGKPPGTVHVGLAGPHGAEARALRLPGDRTLVRSISVVSALNLLRLHLIGS